VKTIKPVYTCTFVIANVSILSFLVYLNKGGLYPYQAKLRELKILNDKKYAGWIYLIVKIKVVIDKMCCSCIQLL